MKKLIISLVLLVPCVCLGQSEAEKAFFAKILDSTCRVSNRGTGVVFAQDSESLWILTAGHVIYDDKNKRLEKDLFVHFFSNGKQSHKMKAEKLWYKYRRLTTDDIAFLKVKKSEFKNYPIPKPIPIAEKTTKIRNGQYIFSAGCPKCTWPTAWKGHILRVSSDRFTFIPRPYKGRSGSGIFTKDGIVGIIIWQTTGGSTEFGTAVSLDKIYKDIGWTEN